MADTPALLALWETARLQIGAVLCLVGAALCLTGTIGVLRFPDIYTRLHAASVIDTGGAGFILLGLALMAPDEIIVIKIVCILIFLVLTSATASHALANAAHASGLQPKIGRMGHDHDEEETAQ